jgi:hypothetical protein
MARGAVRLASELATGACGCPSGEVHERGYQRDRRSANRSSLASTTTKQWSVLRPLGPLARLTRSPDQTGRTLGACVRSDLRSMTPKTSASPTCVPAHSNGRAGHWSPITEVRSYHGADRFRARVRLPAKVSGLLRRGLVAAAKTRGRALLERRVVGYEDPPLTWYVERERHWGEPERV